MVSAGLIATSDNFPLIVGDDVAARCEPSCHPPRGILSHRQCEYAAHQHGFLHGPDESKPASSRRLLLSAELSWTSFASRASRTATGHARREVFYPLLAEFPRLKPTVSPRDAPPERRCAWCEAKRMHRLHHTKKCAWRPACPTSKRFRNRPSIPVVRASTHSNAGAGRVNFATCLPKRSPAVSSLRHIGPQPVKATFVC